MFVSCDLIVNHKPFFFQVLQFNLQINSKKNKFSVFVCLSFCHFCEISISMRFLFGPTCTDTRRQLFRRRLHELERCVGDQVAWLQHQLRHQVSASVQHSRQRVREQSAQWQDFVEHQDANYRHRNHQQQHPQSQNHGCVGDAEEVEATWKRFEQLFQTEHVRIFFVGLFL
jgi:hypothetical protein